MGKRRRHARQATMGVATADLLMGVGHPFYARLNRVLDEAGFDAFVEGQCAPFYAATPGWPRSASVIWAPIRRPGRAAAT